MKIELNLLLTEATAGSDTPRVFVLTNSEQFGVSGVVQALRRHFNHQGKI